MTHAVDDVTAIQHKTWGKGAQSEMHRDRYSERGSATGTHAAPTSWPRQPWLVEEASVSPEPLSSVSLGEHAPGLRVRSRCAHGLKPGARLNAWNGDRGDIWTAVRGAALRGASSGAADAGCTTDLFGAMR